MVNVWKCWSIDLIALRVSRKYSQLWLLAQQTNIVDQLNPTKYCEKYIVDQFLNNNTNRKWGYTKEYHRMCAKLFLKQPCGQHANLPILMTVQVGTYNAITVLLWEAVVFEWQ